MNKPQIQFPRGSGGCWLSNLIWRLENDRLTLPAVDVVFDDEQKSNSFGISHIFETYQGSPIFAPLGDPRSIKFSSPCWFNQYINDAVKVKYHILDLSTESTVDQFFALSDSAVYILTDHAWQTTWGTPGNLEYRLLFEDPEQFVDQLFVLLDQAQIVYTPDRDYCYRNITYYKSTCPNPADYLGNFDSLIWLAWCHAQLQISNISLGDIAGSIGSLEAIRSIVEPRSADVVKNTAVVNWKNEYTTP